LGGEKKLNMFSCRDRYESNLQNIDVCPTTTLTQPMEDEGNIQDSRDLLKTFISGASKHVLEMV